MTDMRPGRQAHRRRKAKEGLVWGILLAFVFLAMIAALVLGPAASPPRQEGPPPKILTRECPDDTQDDLADLDEEECQEVVFP